MSESEFGMKRPSGIEVRRGCPLPLLFSVVLRPFLAVAGVDRDLDKVLENGRERGIVDRAAVAKAVDGRLMNELVGCVWVDGLRLAGEGGLFQHLIERLLESRSGGRRQPPWRIHLDSRSVHSVFNASVAFGGVGSSGVPALPAPCPALWRMGLGTQVHEP
ncbi:hypothetical protein [Streptomyces millisiae]|uniref:Uncharacterized protein n=1 Tax=Streptomyces millisiae TaxID=3075542 RepID=A0ABU2LTT2_9ACTN|nr:hypothetical protein [Streptomyces sp. DSM 44918]MDT0321008.1 hypothetical protein [Streptomyces sp. DSM 44918]